MGTAESVLVAKAYLECQGRCFSKAGKKQKTHPFITISRQTGAGGISIGNKIIEILNREDKTATCPWTVFDKNLLEVALDAHHIPKEAAKYLPEDKISDIRDTVEELFGLHPSEWTVVHKVSDTVLHLAEMGNAIIVGRGANIVTRKLNSGIHVRLVGSLERRIAHTAEFYKLSKEDARKLVEKEDKGRKEYIKKHFDQNIDDPLLYHLVINTDKISYNDAARLIADQALVLQANPGS